MGAQTDIILLQNVCKAYSQGKKHIPALVDLTLSISQGEFISLMGSSGCGKSTVTKIIAGIENIDNGKLFIKGTDCSLGVPKSIQADIGYIFQWHNLAEWRTVEKNLYLPLEMHGIKKDKSWVEKSAKYLQLMGLENYSKVYPHELSGGMRQRVGIARALMTEPVMLIFDQPFGALDAITRGILANEISDLARSEKKTILMVTSNIDEAVRYSDKICVLSDRPGTVKRIINTGITQEQRKRSDFWLDPVHLELKKEVIHTIYSEDEAM